MVHNKTKMKQNGEKKGGKRRRKKKATSKGTWGWIHETFK